MDYDATLQRLLAEREEFLERHPKLREYQAEIDTTLDKTPQEHRLEAIAIMMCTKAMDLAEQLLILNKLLWEKGDGQKL